MVRPPRLPVDNNKLEQIVDAEWEEVDEPSAGTSGSSRPAGEPPAWVKHLRMAKDLITAIGVIAVAVIILGLIMAVAGPADDGQSDDTSQAVGTDNPDIAALSAQVDGATAPTMQPTLAAYSSPAGNSCENAESNMDITDCMAAEYAVADRDLNAAYQQALRATQKFAGGEDCYECGSPEKLRLSQRAWIAWRDRECDLTGSLIQNGSAQPQLELGCLTQLSKDRARQLREISVTFG